MNETDLRAMLKETLEDRTLSRGERKALRAVLEEIDPDDAGKDLLRHVAFGLARDALSRTEDRKILDWLEEAVKVVRAAGSAPARALASRAYFSPGDDCPRVVADAFHHVRRTADVCVFTITSDRVARAVADAHKRGVAVRIITDDEKAQDTGSDIFRLARAGIPVRTDRSHAHMHHKFAVFDGTSLITGSYNWTRSGALSNQDNVILTNDPDLVRDFTGEFEKLWKLFGE